MEHPALHLFNLRFPLAPRPSLFTLHPSLSTFTLTAFPRNQRGELIRVDRLHQMAIEAGFDGAPPVLRAAVAGERDQHQAFDLRLLAAESSLSSTMRMRRAGPLTAADLPWVVSGTVWSHAGSPERAAHPFSLPRHSQARRHARYSPRISRHARVRACLWHWPPRAGC